ncbi:MAG: hypothetical protein L0177_05395 [Chloroflexi bacterium]|nr:hypothetical protein [Chloroflexota bacterium]
MGKKATLLALGMLILLLVACEFNAPPRPESDSGQAYDAGGERRPVDDNVYTITGQVVADVQTMSRQTSPAEGSYNPYTGSYFGAQFGGKGFVRLLVHSVEPSTPLAQVDQIVLIKTSDTKASALLVGDIVTFRCRAQYEAVAAVRINEAFYAATIEKVETWELDYCRLATPIISFEREQ